MSFFNKFLSRKKSSSSETETAVENNNTTTTATGASSEERDTAVAAQRDDDDGDVAKNNPPLPPAATTTAVGADETKGTTTEENEEESPAAAACPPVEKNTTAAEFTSSTHSDDEKGSDYNSADEAQASMMEVSTVIDASQRQGSPAAVSAENAEEQTELELEKETTNDVAEHVSSITEQKLETAVDDVISCEVPEAGAAETVNGNTRGEDVSEDSVDPVDAPVTNTTTDGGESEAKLQESVEEPVIDDSGIGAEHFQSPNKESSEQESCDKPSETPQPSETPGADLSEKVENESSEDVIGQDESSEGVIDQDESGFISENQKELNEKPSEEETGEEEPVIGRRGPDSVSEEEETDEEEEDAVELEEVRESGDGQEETHEDEESDEEEEEELDDDEDQKNPAFVPKRGGFYQHDRRNADEDADLKDAQLKPGRSEKPGKWEHDMFYQEEQAPKTREEIVFQYGYDIRNEHEPPRGGVRPRHYGRQQKQERNWRDEESYRRNRPQGRGGRARGVGPGGPSSPRQQPEDWDRDADFPPLEQGSHARKDQARRSLEGRGGPENKSEGYNRGSHTRERQDWSGGFSQSSGRRNYGNQNNQRRGGYPPTGSDGHTKSDARQQSSGFQGRESAGRRREQQSAGFPTMEFRRSRGAGPKPASQREEWNRDQQQRRGGGRRQDRNYQYYEREEREGVVEVPPRFQSRVDGRFQERRTEQRASSESEKENAHREEPRRTQQAQREHRGAKRYSTQRQQGRQPSPPVNDQQPNLAPLIQYPATSISYTNAGPQQFFEGFHQPPNAVQPQFIVAPAPMSVHDGLPPAGQYVLPRMGPSLPQQDQTAFYVPQAPGAPPPAPYHPAMIPYQAGPPPPQVSAAPDGGGGGGGTQPGMVFYDPDSQQMAARPPPKVRPRKGIPIVPPPENLGPSPSPPPQEPTSTNN